MPKGPQGQWRPADAIGCAVHVAKIATGEIEETYEEPKPPAKVKAGLRGGPARAASLTPERRSEIAAKAATARWGKIYARRASPKKD